MTKTLTSCYRKGICSNIQNKPVDKLEQLIKNHKFIDIWSKPNHNT